MQLVGRRNFFTGLGLGAGAHLLGAMFRTLLPEALGQAAQPKRFVIWVNTYGSSQAQRPQPGGSETDFSLGPLWAPLEPYRSELLYIEKFSNPFNVDLHGNRWALVVADEQPATVRDGPTGPGGISFDRYLAGTLGKNDPWPSLNLACNWYNDSGGASADGVGKRFPLHTDPVKAYGTIFGGGASSVGAAPTAAPERLARDKGLLDHLAADAARMRARLAGPERAKLDQYLESVRGMEVRLTTLAKKTLDCANPAPPAAQKIEPGYATAERFAAFQDIIVNALVCGLTRVVLVQNGGDFYPFLGEDGRIGHHHMWHDQGTPAKFQKFYNFHASQVAAVRRRLGEVRQGNGTVADDSLIMMLNDCGGLHHNGSNDIPLLLVGKAGGALRTGRYVQYPKMKHLISDAFITVAQALGVQATSFGQRSTGPVPGLLV